MKQYYALQDKNFALGNFINCTPTIRYLSLLSGDRVKVKFETDYVKQCFLDCPFMEHVDDLPGPPDVSSAMINKKIPDYQYIFEKVTGKIWASVFHTYVDHDFIHPGFPRYAVFLNGTGNEDPDYIHLKDPGHKPYNFAAKLLMSRGIDVFFTGSKQDRIRNVGLSSSIMFSTNNDIRRSLQLIRHASLVIANDTGLAHAAGAMSVPMLILWKDTLLEKNKNPGFNTYYSLKGNWEKAIQEFLDRFTLP